MSLRAPFPYFGGKRRAAPLVWAALGDVPSYVEPFCGSCAVLLARPDSHRGGVETVNDANRFIANFWRSVQAAPDEVAHWADWPVNEADLHARHHWLVYAAPDAAEWRARMHRDPDFYDAKRAGWWVWGHSAWIGSGWCPDRDSEGALSDQLPHLGDPGMGVHAPGLSDQLPHLGDPGRGVHAVMAALAARLRRVRVACGDWSRVCGDSVLHPHRGCLAGVFLDPPYAAEGQEGAALYGAGDASLSAAVREWAIEHGNDPTLRIVLCGYAGEHDMPDGWTAVPWKAAGGYEGQRRERRTADNSTREVLYLSPHCLRTGAHARQPSLFECMDGVA